MTVSHSLLPIIQGGMGVGISDWRLARAVSLREQLGVVSAWMQPAIISVRKE
jgi:nitronate monooxygenase